jgi:transposase
MKPKAALERKRTARRAGNLPQAGLRVLDQAGWHVAKELKVPRSIHLFPLPPYTPELSPAEHLSERVY